MKAKAAGGGRGSVVKRLSLHKIDRSLTRKRLLECLAQLGGRVLQPQPAGTQRSLRRRNQLVLHHVHDD